MMTVIQYPGKKNSIASWIINNFPSDYKKMTYLEPFFGSGSIFFCKERSEIETINDKDSDITNLFMQIRDNHLELMIHIFNTPWSRDEYNLSYEKTDDPLERARRCLVRYWLTIGANTRTKNGMRTEIEKNTGGYKYFHIELPNVIKLIAERLRHDAKGIIQIENRDVFELILKYNRENVLMYLDPPYLLETRKNKLLYRYEFTDSDHERLLKMIVNSKAKIIISGYMSDLYSDYLKDWRLEEKTTKDQAGNKRTECIWMNYKSSQNNLFNKDNL